MLTYEKVLEVFKEYLEEDNSCEVVNTSRGHAVMMWDDRMKKWYDVKAAPTPEALRDVLLDNYNGYLTYKMTDEGRRNELTEQEKREIEAICRAILERCQ